jgi:hypothetical protein
VWESKLQNRYLSPTFSTAPLPLKNDLVPNGAETIIARDTSVGMKSPELVVRMLS